MILLFALVVFQKLYRLAVPKGMILLFALLVFLLSRSTLLCCSLMLDFP